MFIHCSGEIRQIAMRARSVEQSRVLVKALNPIKTDVLAMVEVGDGGTKSAGNSLRVKYD